MSEEVARVVHRSAWWTRRRQGAAAALLAALLPGCGASQSGPSCPEPLAELGPSRLAAGVCASGVSSERLLSQHRVAYRSSLGYDPLSASGLELLAPAGLELSADQLTRLKQNGFVVLPKESGTFAAGYAHLFAKHLPVYVSADSILEAVHRSYDSLLQQIETRYLSAELTLLLQDLRFRLRAPQPGFSRARIRDVDLHLAVALSLLIGKQVDPVGGAAPQEIRELYEAAQAAAGPRPLELFGLTRSLDFSQLKPRGHYADSEPLRRYFRALMWLGLVDIPLVHAEADQPLTLRRAGFESALLFAQLFSEPVRCRARNIEQVLTSFVGFPQQLSLDALQALFRELGITTPEDLAAQPDAVLKDAVLATQYRPLLGASQVLRVAEAGLAATAQPRSFALVAKRYTPDGQVLTEVSFDRIAGGGVRRMMPSPLDVAFAALGNDHAAQLLSSELATYPYATELACSRELVDHLDPGYWQSSLYSAWLAALRSLSPPPRLDTPVETGLPAVASTEAWARRLLSTQLSSWAELRHDTLLYTAPSYALAIECEFPAAYVEPYPEFFRALSRFAQVGQNTLAALAQPTLQHAIDYFIRLGEVLDLLTEMAEHERRGQPLTATQLAFINSLVSESGGGCTGPSYQGWYSQLHFDPSTAAEEKPVIADVFTQPSDETGRAVGRVLHVGSGLPRFMVLTIDGCGGSQTYVGPVSSYYETITEGYQRLDDRAWQARFWGPTRPPEVPWMQDLIGR